jgi:nucleoside-diphosphate-sugar epimerase
VGVKNMLEFAREKRVKSLLYFSSSEIYGDPDPKHVPTPETYRGHVSSIGPRACYDESKRLGETLCVTYHQVYQVPVKIVRPFNVYGPGMSPADHRAVPAFLSKGFNGEHLHVYGGGKQTRTFCYIADATVGFLKILLSNKDGEVYNVGNDLGEIDMNGLATMVAEVVFNNKVQAKLEAYPNQYPTDEPQRRCPDLTKIRKDLGYIPSVDVKTGLKRTSIWFEEFLRTNR